MQTGILSQHSIQALVLDVEKRNQALLRILRDKSP